MGYILNFCQQCEHRTAGDITDETICLRCDMPVSVVTNGRHSCPLGKFGIEKKITPALEADPILSVRSLSQAEIKVSEQEVSVAKQCIEICKLCEHYQPDKLTAENSEANPLIRIAGNAIKTVADWISYDIGFRCGKCGCFGKFKARLLQGKGCPENRWVNDDNEN